MVKKVAAISVLFMLDTVRITLGAHKYQFSLRWYRVVYLIDRSVISAPGAEDECVQLACRWKGAEGISRTFVLT